MVSEVRLKKIQKIKEGPKSSILGLQNLVWGQGGGWAPGSPGSAPEYFTRGGTNFCFVYF